MFPCFAGFSASLEHCSNPLAMARAMAMLLVAAAILGAAHATTSSRFVAPLLALGCAQLGVQKGTCTSLGCANVFPAPHKKKFRRLQQSGLPASLPRCQRAEGLENNALGVDCGGLGGDW